MSEIDRRTMLRRVGMAGAVAGAGALGGTSVANATTTQPNSTSRLLRAGNTAALDRPQMTVLTDKPGTALGNIYYTI